MENAQISWGKVPKIKAVEMTSMSIEVAQPDMELELSEKPVAPSLWKALQEPSWRAWLAWSTCGMGGVMLGYNCFYLNGVLAMDFFKHDFGRPSNNVDSFEGYMYDNGEKAVLQAIFAVGVGSK